MRTRERPIRGRQSAAMGFRAKYSAEQNEAIIGVQLDDGMTAADAVAAAAAGELEHGGKRLAPFAMPWRTARDKASEARRARRLVAAASVGADAQMDTADARIVALLNTQITKAERAHRSGRLTPEMVTSLARAKREVSAMLRGAGGKTQSASAPAKTDEPDLVGGLAAVL